MYGVNRTSQNLQAIYAATENEQILKGEKALDALTADEISKGGKSTIGEKRTFGGREYIKTAGGWKYHGKGTGSKAREHRDGALDHHVSEGAKSKESAAPSDTKSPVEILNSKTKQLLLIEEKLQDHNKGIVELSSADLSELKTKKQILNQVIKKLEEQVHSRKRSSPSDSDKKAQEIASKEVEEEFKEEDEKPKKKEEDPDDDDDEMEKGDEPEILKAETDLKVEEAVDLLVKGKSGAVLGEKRTFGGREYIKTATGWKYHGKGTGTKAQEHAAGSNSGKQSEEKKEVAKKAATAKEIQLSWRPLDYKKQITASYRGNEVTIGKSEDKTHYNDKGWYLYINNKKIEDGADSLEALQKKAQSVLTEKEAKLAPFIGKVVEVYSKGIKDKVLDYGEKYEMLNKHHIKGSANPMGYGSESGPSFVVERNGEKMLLEASFGNKLLSLNK